MLNHEICKMHVIKYKPKSFAEMFAVSDKKSDKSILKFTDRTFLSQNYITMFARVSQKL